MMPRDFPGSNVRLTKPAWMKDQECMETQALEGIDEGGNKFIATAWFPSKEDIEAINQGRPIILKVYGGGTPPISLFTLDENGKPNV